MSNWKLIAKKWIAADRRYKYKLVSCDSNGKMSPKKTRQEIVRYGVINYTVGDIIKLGTKQEPKGKESYTY